MLVDRERLLDRESRWLQAVTATLKVGLHQDGLEILPHIALEYWPQWLFEIGVIISVTTLMGCIGYLIFDRTRSWRRRRETR